MLRKGYGGGLEESFDEFGGLNIILACIFGEEKVDKLVSVVLHRVL